MKNESRSPLHALRSILPWAVIGVLLGLVLLVALTVVGIFTRFQEGALAPLEPEITVVPLPSPTATVPLPTATPTPDWTPTPVPPPQLEGSYSPGDLVQVFGTGGDGLRFRNQPGLNSTIAFLGVENEVFEVRNGPREADGYEWWYLVNPYSTDKAGWVVGNYLRRVESP
ncbi:MAG: hypothetical protein ACK2T2_02340 [Anaerolineales bacterium]